MNAAPNRSTSSLSAAWPGDVAIAAFLQWQLGSLVRYTGLSQRSGSQYNACTRVAQESPNKGRQAMKNTIPATGFPANWQETWNEMRIEWDRLHKEISQLRT